MFTDSLLHTSVEHCRRIFLKLKTSKRPCPNYSFTSSFYACAQPIQCYTIVHCHYIAPKASELLKTDWRRPRNQLWSNQAAILAFLWEGSEKTRETS